MVIFQLVCHDHGEGAEGIVALVVERVLVVVVVGGVGKHLSATAQQLVIKIDIVLLPSDGIHAAAVGNFQAEEALVGQDALMTFLRPHGMVIGDDVAVFLGAADEIVHKLCGVLPLHQRSDFRNGGLLLVGKKRAGLGVEVYDAGVVGISGEEIQMHFAAERSEGTVTDEGLIAGEHEKIRLGHVGEIVGGLMVGDAKHTVAVGLVGILQLLGGEVAVGVDAVAVKVCLKLLFGGVDQVHKSTSFYKKEQKNNRAVLLLSKISRIL